MVGKLNTIIARTEKVKNTVVINIYKFYRFYMAAVVGIITIIETNLIRVS